MIGFRRVITVGILLPAGRGERLLKAMEPTDQQTFADELTELMYSAQSTDNECSSALGVSMAFSLLYPGLTGKAVDQVRKALGYPDDNAQLVWEETTQSLLAGNDGGEVWGNEAPLLKISNSVWLDDGSVLDPLYEDVVGEYAKQIDFQANNSGIIVNDWVDKSTNGLIDSIVDEDKPLFPPYVLIAINSIYLKARWNEQFDEYNTNLDSFYASVGSTDEASKAHFMNTLGYFDYSHEALQGYQVINLPLAGSRQSQMSMIFVLPTSDGIGAASSTDVIKALGDMKETRVALSVPKFKFESKYDDKLIESLKEMGITDPFAEGTGALCGIFEDEDGCEKLIISKFIQKTVIDVNEKGVEAAAVTAAMAVPTSIGPVDINVPVLMVLDHPFQFFIYDESEKVALFEGRLGAPEIPDAKPEADLLDAKHSDVDFWSKRFGVDPTCPKDACLDPVGKCAGMVQCFADPCSVTQKCAPESCTSNYCGGCHAVCDVAEVAAPTEPMNATEHQMFADELTGIMYANENECSSALGVSMAFSLIYPGSTGDGIEEIQDTFRYPEGSNMHLVWEDTTKAMLGGAAGQDSAPLLRIANSVWFDDEDTLNQDYKSVVGDYAIQIDFEANTSGVLVNEWVSNSTNGLIKTIVPEDKPLFPPYVLIAVNSIYLKAAWGEQFETRKTNLDSFYGSFSRSAQVSEAHFMNMVESFDYSHDALPGYQVIDLPFRWSQMSMIFVLPLSDDAKAVSSTELISALGDLQRTRVALSVPKFKFASEYDDVLKDSLEKLGIEAPFKEGAGALCGLFEDTEGCKKLIIDKIVQKTVVDVNEDGVEATAVTAIGVGITSIPTYDSEPMFVILDHPFQFFIYDASEGLMLFEGRVGAPEIPGGSEAPLQAKHSDGDFWKNAFGVDPEAPPAFVTITGSTVPADLTVSKPTDASSGSSNTTQPTEAAGTSTSQPTEASSGSSNTTQPTEAAGPSETDSVTHTSSGEMAKRNFSLATCLFLAYALGFVW